MTDVWRAEPGTIRVSHSSNPPYIRKPPYKPGTMSSENSIAGEQTKEKRVVAKVPSLRQGDLDLVNDHEISSFYGSSVTKSYRLKSELIARHLSDIGMGK